MTNKSTDKGGKFYGNFESVGRICNLRNLFKNIYDKEINSCGK